ncbi:hypothetical protein SK128_017233 [Halocaridina rubra]|uniref:LRRNT domain-containing protein n=1 Tax=Halocaridina rubra TaxID=373956 RepID=A0AAN8WW01_HALRR
MWCSVGLAGLYYPLDSLECPMNCECAPTSIACEGGIIPKLDPGFAGFEVRDANPPVKVFTTNLAENMKHVVSLHLVSVGLERFEREALAKISRLETLHITHNNIETIMATDFEGCKNLASLNLENNGIRIIENDTFRSLTTLKELNLAHNAIKVLPQTFPKGVQMLNFEDNEIEFIPDFTFHELLSLNLCDNKIHHIHPDKFDLNNLLDLCLGGPNFTVNPALISNEKFPHLEILKLSGHKKGNIYIDDRVQRNILLMVSQSLYNLTLESCT